MQERKPQDNTPVDPQEAAQSRREAELAEQSALRAAEAHKAVRQQEITRVITLLEKKDDFLDKSEEKAEPAKQKLLEEQCSLRAKLIQQLKELLPESKSSQALESSSAEKSESKTSPAPKTEANKVMELRASLRSQILQSELPEAQHFCDKAFQIQLMLTEQWPKNDLDPSNYEPIDPLSSEQVPTEKEKRVVLGNYVYSIENLRRYFTTNNAFRVYKDKEVIEVLDPMERTVLTQREIAYLELCGVKFPERDRHLLIFLQANMQRGGVSLEAFIRQQPLGRSGIMPLEQILRRVTFIPLLDVVTNPEDLARADLRQPFDEYKEYLIDETTQYYRYTSSHPRGGISMGLALGNALGIAVGIAMANASIAAATVGILFMPALRASFFQWIMTLPTLTFFPRDQRELPPRPRDAGERETKVNGETKLEQRDSGLSQAAHLHRVLRQRPEPASVTPAPASPRSMRVIAEILQEEGASPQSMMWVQRSLLEESNAQHSSGAPQARTRPPGPGERKP